MLNFIIHYATYELCGNVENGLEGEPPPARVEEVFEARSEEFHHQSVVLPARAKIVHLRYTLCGLSIILCIGRI